MWRLYNPRLIATMGAVGIIAIIGGGWRMGP